MSLVERPPAVRHPVALFEVDLVEWRVPHSGIVAVGQLDQPAIGRASVLRGAAVNRINWIIPDHGAGKKRLRLPILRVQPTALKETNSKVTAGQFSRHRQACRPAADDANFSLDNVARWQLTRVNQHNDILDQ